MTNVSITRNQNALETNVIQRTTMVEGYIANPVGVPVGFLDCELISNKVQNIGPNSTSAQYPSAKAVFEAISEGGGSFSQKQSDWTQEDQTQVDYIKNKPSLSAVATSGSYTDLTDKPTIPTVPTNISAFTNDSGYITLTDVPAQVQTDWNATTGLASILNKPNLATVATSGSYTDLTDKPTIPVQAQAISSGETGYVTGDQVYQIVGDVESLLLALRGNV